MFQLADMLKKKDRSPRCNGIHCGVCGKSDDPLNHMMSAAFLANPSLVQLLAKLQAMSQMTTQAECVGKM